MILALNAIPVHPSTVQYLEQQYIRVLFLEEHIVTDMTISKTNATVHVVDITTTGVYHTNMVTFTSCMVVSVTLINHHRQLK